MALVIFVAGLVFWLLASEPSEKASVAAADAAFMVAWFAVVGSLHMRLQIKATSGAIEIAVKQVEISNRTAQTAVNAEHNAMAPVIKLSATQVGGTGIRVDYWNVGKGPAMNLTIWIRHSEKPHLETIEFQQNETAVGVGEDGAFRWVEDQDLPGLRLGAEIVARYNDVFKRTLESRLEFVTNGPPALYYGTVPDQTVA
ncbi:MAG: hypothetical protein O3A47_02715 [Chloroflexi bacterium]|nr:hypothetical protein [Chloroflexota bacterium]